MRSLGERKMGLFDKLKSVDRRIIFILVGLGVIIPVLVPIGLKIQVSPPAQRLYDAIEELPSGSAVLMAFDYGPSTMPEIQPMTIALLRHCFTRDLKVIGMALWAEGASLAQRAFDEVAPEFGKEYGADYINLGFKAGGLVVINAMGRSIPAIFPADFAGNPIDGFPIMSGVRNFDQIGIIVDLSAGDPGIRAWVMIAQARFHKKVGAGCTAVSAPAFYPYLQTGQLVGLLGGLKGAAEYEALVGYRGPASRAMDPQAIAHGVIILFIVLGNITYFWERWRTRAKE